MFSNTRPNAPLIFGGPGHADGQDRHFTAAETLDRARSGATAVIRHDDPRTRIDGREVLSMSTMRSYEGLENAAMRALGPQAKDAMMADDGRMTHRAALNAAVQAARTGAGPAKDADAAYGSGGRLAATLEATGLKMYAEARTKGDADLEAGAMRALTVAAAAHNMGAREASLRGTDATDISVVQAAAAQGRDPRAVAQDLVRHGALDSKDIRASVDEASISSLDKTSALARVAPARPVMPGRDAETNANRAANTNLVASGMTIARRAEQNAVRLAGQTDGSAFDAQTRQEAAKGQMAAAYAIERMRQQEVRARTSERAPEAQPTAEQPRRVSVFRRGGEAR